MLRRSTPSSLCGNGPRPRLKLLGSVSGNCSRSAGDAALDGLHLPSLRIEGFRGIERLDVGRLGRVTLLAGRNGTGKTTVLDAVHVFASRGHAASLREVLARNEEFEDQFGEESDTPARLNFEALFYGRVPGIGTALSVGAIDQGSSRLRISVSEAGEESYRQTALWKQQERLQAALDEPALEVSFGDFKDYLPVFQRDVGWPRPPFGRPRRGLGSDVWPEAVSCHSLGPGLLDNRQLDRLWSSIVLTASEPLALNALQLASHLKIGGVAMVSGDNRPCKRRVVVKLETGQRVPLRSLGDGAVRLFGVALALANAAGGFLLVDEAEKGIHHSLQQQFWSFILQKARRHSVQILATTHSWDCIRSFAAAASEDDNVEGSLVRLERSSGALQAVEYSEEELGIAAQQGIEVR